MVGGYSIDRWLFRSLSRVYGSLVGTVIDRLYKPCSRHYLRVNTMVISRDELLEMFRNNYPDYRFEPDPYFDDALYVVVKGPYRVPVVDKKIVVDKNAAESILLGAPVYRPGILKYSEFHSGDEVNIVAPNGRVVALAIARVDSSSLKIMKKGVVADNIVSEYRLPPIREMEEYKKGLFHPQSLPAIMVSHILSPKPSELILDCCASPGGKTSHVIQLSRGLAKIVSIDRSVKKLLKIIDTIDRLGLPKNLVLLPLDARYLDRDLGLIGFDKALLDPPCTALGVRPKIYIDKTYSDLVNTVNYQKQFVKPVSKLLKKGGLLVYSTCTLTFEENEDVSIKFLNEGFTSIEIDIPYADKVYVGDLVAYRFHPLNYDMNGYYIAVFKKTS